MGDVLKGSGIQKGTGLMRAPPNILYSVNRGRGRAGSRARAAQFSSKRLLDPPAWIIYILVPGLAG